MSAYILIGLLVWRRIGCSGVGRTSGLPVRGVSDSVPLLASQLRARGPANRQTGGLPHAPR